MTNAQALRVFAFDTGWGVPFPTSAPFPLKLCTWLRMAGIPYELVVQNDPSKGPKGKSPWIELDGVVMGDSSLIMAHLGQRFGVDLDAHLSPQERALALSVQRMLEEHYHQAFEHQLFLGRGGAERVAEFVASLPPMLKWIVPKVLLRSLRKQLHARGLARHTDSEIVAQGKADLDALSCLLGDRSYFSGDKVSSINACVLGFLGCSVYVRGDNPLFTYAASISNLTSYCERMRTRYFPETLPSSSAAA